MKLALLTRNPKLYSTQRLVQAAQALQHEIYLLDTLRCYLAINQKKPMVYYKGQALEQIDAIVPRIGASISYYGIAVVRQFELMGIYTLNTAQAINASRDKLLTAQLLTQQGLNVPHSGFMHHQEDIKATAELVGGAPLVIKLLEGTQGLGVILAEKQQLVESVAEGLREVKAAILLQEFIAEAQGTDIRCIVLGQEVIASMQRQAAKDEFRSNLHRGGQASVVDLSAEEAALAIQAAQALGLDFAGVDLMRTRRGPAVLEVNSSPGLEGIEAVTGCQIAERVIKFIEDRLESRNTVIPYNS
ncbi:MAG: 30S ribosomal protein S6--L-glutamate ligase [Thiothrix sp.]|nr:MAG: 30S ribosomal protein S6--L-glutamate ligase [Thiothrix sp.]